jgi:hypothetical protein
VEIDCADANQQLLRTECRDVCMEENCPFLPSFLTTFGLIGARAVQMELIDLYHLQMSYSTSFCPLSTLEINIIGYFKY